jgi:hypothetical protein
MLIHRSCCLAIAILIGCSVIQAQVSLATQPSRSILEAASRISTSARQLRDSVRSFEAADRLSVIELDVAARSVVDACTATAQLFALRSFISDAQEDTASAVIQIFTASWSRQVGNQIAVTAKIVDSVRSASLNRIGTQIGDEMKAIRMLLDSLAHPTK